MNKKLVQTSVYGTNDGYQWAIWNDDIHFVSHCYVKKIAAQNNLKRALKYLDLKKS